MTPTTRPIAVSIGITLVLTGATLFSGAAIAADTGTWRCTAADGKVLFTNGKCPEGTARATPFVPAPVVTGVARDRARPGSPAPVAANDAPDPLLPAGRVDPFVDCKARGGAFDLASRVCRLPPGGTRTWTQAD